MVGKKGREEAREMMSGAESCLPEGTTGLHLFSAFLSRGHCVNYHKVNAFEQYSLHPYSSGYWKSEVTVSIGPKSWFSQLLGIL